MQVIDLIFTIIILIMSAVAHEVSHGYAANMMGDPTARYAGRLTLNPFKHLDLFGSVLMPLMLVVLKTGIIFGWAKPVPYNPYNLRNKRWGELMVAVAGPLANLIIAVVFGLILRFGAANFSPSFLSISVKVIEINIMLAIFNLVPIPPLDGSKIAISLLPVDLSLRFRLALEKYGFLALIIFILFFWRFLQPLIGKLFQLITGFGF